MQSAAECHPVYELGHLGTDQAVLAQQVSEAIVAQVEGFGRLLLIVFRPSQRPLQQTGFEGPGLFVETSLLPFHIPARQQLLAQIRYLYFH